MRKLLLFTILPISLIGCSNPNTPVPITGFWDIPFGSSKELVIREMKSKGIEFEEEKEYRMDHYTGNFNGYVQFKEGGAFAGKHVNWMIISFAESDMCSAYLSLRINGNNDQKTELNSLIESLKEKYPNNKIETSGDTTRIIHTPKSIFTELDYRTQIEVYLSDSDISISYSVIAKDGVNKETSNSEQKKSTSSDL